MHNGGWLGALTQVLDLGGTFVFAISGAVVAVRRRMDVLGVLVPAFAAGNAGGITRDPLIGAVPPAALAHWSCLAVSAAAGLIVFFGHRLTMPLTDKRPHPVPVILLFCCSYENNGLGAAQGRA